MVARAAQRAAPASVVTAIADAVHVLSSIFQTTRPDARIHAAHLWALASLMIAGAIVRFWGLGDVSLHGDEETMAMAVQGILADGRPVLPSGMFYPRAMTQLYAMALSVSIFGESEWALRLPSVLCGVAAIGLAYVVGRRFLRPQWNLAFAATVAFLPVLILWSQTARMYIFLVASVMASLACLFAWERTDRGGWLIGAVLALVIGLDMHLLAVAAMPMMLLPGLAGRDLRKLLQGVGAALVIGLAYLAFDALTDASYPVPPPEFAADLAEEPRGGLRSLTIAPDFAAAWAAGIAMALLAVYLARAIALRPAAVAGVALLLAGVGLQLALFYHLAALAYLAGMVVARRYGSAHAGPRILILAIACLVLAVIHVSQLEPGTSLIRLTGALIGQPSVWPYVRVAQLSEVAGVLTFALIAWGLYQIAHARPVSDYWLLAVLGVWAPVFALGIFAWNAPPRYASMSLAPMLLCAFAFAQHATDRLIARFAPQRTNVAAQILAATLAAMLMINPARAASVANAGYRIHPDHKGAAEFMQSQAITPADIVLAEDVLQQTYYLGSVDYWLIGKRVARHYVTREGDRFVDFYTGTPVVSTAALLDALMEQHVDRRIFVIGSGENQRDGRRHVRGADLHAALESGRFEVVFTGRDGRTRVLRALPRRATE